MQEDEDFDLGPLTWVKAEIDAALAAAVQALSDWNGEDIAPLKAAEAYLHQVTGALNIVDLQGVAAVCAETERLLADMAVRDELRTARSAQVVSAACEAIRGFLDELINGAPNTELRLSPVYAQVAAQRGAEPPAPSALFFPDLDVRVSRPDPAPALDASVLARVVRQARARYQKGLLKFLRNREPETGLMEMEQAVRELERLAPDANLYTFWWLVTGFVESLRRGGLLVDFWVKRLCGRIDLQMRRLMEGSRQLSERLQRDVLYYLALDQEGGGRAQEARRLYRLDRYLPSPQLERITAVEADFRPHLKALREAIATAKDHWMRVCTGRPESLAPFQAAASSLFEAASQLTNESLKNLSGMVDAVAKRLLSVADTAQNEALQLEMATALLLIQNATEHFQALGNLFDRQADVMIRRLQAAIDPSDDVSRIPTDVPLLDEISRAAQEKMILAQVTQEIQSNLSQVEEILDRFFRDRNERSRLPLVPGLMKQVLGAFNILQLDAAADLTRAGLEQIDRFADPEHHITPEELNWVADTISTLGLYVEALRYGRDDRQQLVNLLARRETLRPREASVETQLREAVADLQRQAEALSGDEFDADTRSKLAGELRRIARDADLIGDLELKSQAEQALQQVTAEGSAGAMRAAIQQLGLTRVTAAPSAEALKLAAASTEEIDAEMLSVYIEEAKDVLGKVVAGLARLQANLFDADAFVAIRRGFHTLKGSGRMVGLDDMAEVAWQVEDTLNQWLRAERSPTPEVLDFLDKAVGAFGAWVQVLEAGMRPHVEAGELLAWAQRLRGQVAASEDSPPPKSEIGAPAPPPGGGEEDQIEIDGHRLPAALYNIFIEEATQRLADLKANLSRMAHGHDAASWEDFFRSAHTLAGIARTTGFGPLAEAAHAIEQWASTWPDKVSPLAAETQKALEICMGLLDEMVAAIRDRHWPQAQPQIAECLGTLKPAVVGPKDSAPAEVGMKPPETIQATDAAPAITPTEPAIDTVVATEATKGAAVALATPTEVPAEEATLRDDLDQQLLPIFLDEAAELMPRIGESLRQWRNDPTDAEALIALKRALHTLKGSARMAGAMRLGEYTHRVETRLQTLGESTPTAAFIDELEADYDHLLEMVDALQGRPTLRSGPVTSAADPIVPQPAIAAVIEDDQRLKQTLKLKANVLDTLLNEAGEVAIARARVQSLLASYKQTAQELTANVERLRNQLRELEIQAESQMRTRLNQMEEAGEFDPLEFDRYTRLQELTRLLSESVNDVSTAQDNLLAGIEDADRTLDLQARMMRNLQHELMRMRMMPFATLSERLHRVVRQTAKALERKVKMEIEGGRTELDRTVLDRIAVPLEHLLRNAVAHGIEPPQQRLAAGKPEYGEIRLTLRQEGNEIVITVADDGAGIDYAAVRARALALGWIKPEDEVTPVQLEAFLFAPGFTTARAVTAEAGRGIGLDVVKNEIAGMGGRVRIESEPGKGTRFIIRLPLTLAVMPVVLVRAGSQVCALPANIVTLVREVRPEELARLLTAGGLEVGGEHYPLRSLAELMNSHSQPVEAHYRTLLLLRAGAERLALSVDALEGNLEAVLKNTGPQVARIPGVIGATILGDGRIALILNPFALAEWVPRQTKPLEEAPTTAGQPPLVLVVDDSLTVRKITSRLLTREGYRVATAKDGVEALEFLQDELPAVILLDIEMPRMDGYEVTRAIRADSRLKEIPIIMITSRTADKHRRYALDLGVNHYMGKPFDEQALLELIAKLIGQAVPA